MGTIEVLVRYKGNYSETFGRVLEIPDLYIQAFQPVRKADDPLLASIFGESSEDEAQVVYKLRSDAAEDLARIISEALLLDMNKKDTINGYPIEAVIHFAGLKAVGESVSQPLRYYETNLVSTLNLLKEMAAHQVRQLVFSSSATVYGRPEILPIPESAATGPTNPYGRTKLMVEDICRDVAATADGWQISLLRYFNPVGAHPSGDLGEDPQGVPNNLVPFVMQVAVGRREQVQVFGDDWDTPDGTGVRDYIHVLDLANGHLAALDNLPDGCDVYNLGTGTGSSVFDIIKTTENVSGQAIPFEVIERRHGDIGTSLADPGKANIDLDWRADRSLEVMLTDAWNWQSKHPEGFASE